MYRLGPLTKEASSIALEKVSEWSDFKVQTTNPYAGDFIDEPEFAYVLGGLAGGHPGLDPALLRTMARAGFCSAIELEKTRRVRDRKWDPYGPQKC